MTIRSVDTRKIVVELAPGRGDRDSVLNFVAVTLGLKKEQLKIEDARGASKFSVTPRHGAEEDFEQAVRRAQLLR
jgi:hypothetical protein